MKLKLTKYKISNLNRIFGRDNSIDTTEETIPTLDNSNDSECCYSETPHDCQTNDGTLRTNTPPDNGLG